MYRLIVVVRGEDAGLSPGMLNQVAEAMRDEGSVRLVSPTMTLDVDIKVWNA